MEERRNILLRTALIMAIIAALFAFRLPQVRQPESSGIYNESGEELPSGEVHELPRAMLFAATSDNAEVTVKATVKPENAYDKRVDWAIRWADPEALGDAENYLSVTPESDGSNIATVKMLNRFTSQIILSVTSRADPDISVSCTIDAQTVILGEILNADTRYIPEATEELSVAGYMTVYKCPLQFGDFANGFLNVRGATRKILYGSLNREISYAVEPSSQVKPALTSAAQAALTDAGLDFVATVFPSGITVVAEDFYKYFDCDFTENEKISKLYDVFLEFQDKPFFEFANTAENGNGSLTEKIGLTFGSESLRAPITGIELDRDSIIF